MRLAQFLCLFLRGGGVAGSPCAGLAGGVELLLFRRAHRREKFNVKMEVVARVLTVYRSLVHAHHVRERIVKQAVERAGGLL